MKLLLTFFSFISLVSFSQNDSLFAYVFNENNDYLERMKVAETLFNQDSTNSELNEILFDYFVLTGKNKKLCICHRNSDYSERNIIRVGRELYGDFRCALVEGNVCVADSLFNYSKSLEHDFFPSNYMAYDLSSYYNEKGNFENALQIIKQYSWKTHTNLSWLDNSSRNLYIRLLQINGKYEELIVVYDSLLQKSPSNEHYLIQLAQANTYLGNYNKAIELYNTVIELEAKENSSIVVALAKVHSKNNDTLLANENYQKAIKIDSTDISNYYAFLEHLDNYSLNIERDFLISVVLSKPITDFKSEYPSEIYQWFSYISLNLRKQLNYINKAIKIERDSTQLANYYNAKGLIFQRRFKNKKALKSYTKALEYDSTMIQPYLNRGNVYLRKFNEKSQENAKYDFEKVLLISQFHYYPALANLGLGQYYYNKRNYENSMEKLTISIEQNPENAWAYYYLSRIYYAKRDFEKSIDSLEKAVEWNPNETIFSISLEVEKEHLLKSNKTITN